MDQLKNLVGAAAAEDNVRFSFKGGIIFVEFDRRRQQQGRLGGDLVSTGEISSQVGFLFETFCWLETRLFISTLGVCGSEAEAAVWQRSTLGDGVR